MKKLHQPRDTVLPARVSPFLKLELYKEKIAGKKAVLVFDQLESHPDLIHLAKLHLPTADVTAVSLTGFVDAVWKMKADIVFIHNPRNLQAWMPDLVRLMPRFRDNTPKSVVLMTHAHLKDDKIQDGIQKLRARKCLDHVEPDSVLLGRFLLSGVELLAKRQDLQ